MNAWAVNVGIGAACLAHDGELWIVVGMEAGCVVLVAPAGGVEQNQWTPASVARRYDDSGARSAQAAPSPMGSVFDDLSDAEHSQLSERLGHVREVL